MIVRLTDPRGHDFLAGPFEVTKERDFLPFAESTQALMHGVWLRETACSEKDDPAGLFFVRHGVGSEE